METFFGHVLTNLALTKCRLVTKHVLFITHFHSCSFLTFPFKFYLYKEFKLFIKDYLFFIYTFMCMIIFLRIIILSFHSHQTRILNAGLGMVWNRDTDCPDMTIEVVRYYICISYFQTLRIRGLVILKQNLIFYLLGLLFTRVFLVETLDQGDVG